MKINYQANKSFNPFVLCLLTGILCLFLSSCSSYKVIHITGNNKYKIKNKNGFYYNLPQTAIKVDITVRHTYLNKGPYADYADKYFGLSNIIKQDAETFEIADVHISSIPQPDPSHYYFVRNTNLCKKHRRLCLSLTNDGLIQGFNIRPINEANESGTMNAERKMLTHNASRKFVLSDNMGEKIDTIIEKYKTDTISIEKKIYKKVAAEKSSEIKAKEAADHLMKIKDNKFNVITGFSEVPYTEGALRYMKEQLDHEQQKYLTLFTGDSSSYYVKYSFVYVPKKSYISNENALFLFSPKEGIVKNQDSRGDAVTITVENKNITKLSDKYQNKLDSTNAKKNGFYYRIPDSGKITVRKGKTILAENEFLISQFGIISHLPSSVRKIKFVPELGSINFLMY